MRIVFSIVAGVLILAVSACGIVHGMRSSVAQGLYRQAKFGSARDNPRGVFRRCERAQALYPYNYNFCILAAEMAYGRARGMVTGSELREISERWCDEGLKLNRYRRKLRVLKAKHLAVRSPEEAVTYWEEYVDWHFWDPYNHALLANIYASAGYFGKALESLEWVKGSEHHEKAAASVRSAWRRESISRRLPPR